MNTEKAALCLAKLGHPARLSIFKLLIRYGHTGLTVGDIQKRLDIAPTTLNHHIEHLQKAGWLSKSKDGREVHCRANFKLMDQLVNYLSAECCTDAA